MAPDFIVFCLANVIGSPKCGPVQLVMSLEAFKKLER
jgi:hypothetical protein